MRVRRKPGAFEALCEIEPYFVKNPELRKGNWKEVFGNDNPIHAEFGGGKGRFSVEMARMYPNVNFIMADAVTEVALVAAKRMKKAALNNVRLILLDLKNVEDVFSEGELDQIYLNFSDPWPKKRHYKRRLTYRDFLMSYKAVLKSEGWIHFKTDNRSLFQFSLNEFAALDMKMQHISLNLHDESPEGNVMTEYEEKFSKMGHPIYRVETQFRK
ncbi:tRNA (guanosine(46)-N7)-methyltransferase TrmB [Fusibacter tunisiensis]|uniref:tRNA (guanine-N(7)-)-methyltransferase n=1 Tax=Fusibacter tunisiensis TaxID=1008308 RepID=A0ABS2MR75_9FIRM|nr:tRNA (guanine-N7-)-methyltransferase [Fusibacter tunisiensis]